MKTGYLLPSLPDLALWLKEKSKYILAIVVTYLFFLIINLPASIVFPALKLPGNIKVTGISGTAWSGSIRNLYISGVNLGSVSWTLQPSYLLIGAVAADISIVKKQQHINSWVKLSASGKVELEETRININLSSLQPLIYGMPFSYGGIAHGHFPVSYFKKNEYVAINGILSLRNIEMLSPQKQAFGGLDIDFRAEKEGMTSGLLKGNGEELTVSGKLIINKNGLLKLSTKLAARQKGSSLDRVVSFLGPKDASGQVQLNNHFKLWE